jgi:Retrotransposon gag protein
MPSPTPPTISLPITLTIEELQNQIAHLQQLVNGLSAQPQPTSTNNSSKLKVAPPDLYDGTPSNLETFISQLALYLFNKGYSDHDRISFSLSYMKGGTAGPWAKQKVQEFIKNDGISQTYVDFLKELRETFGDPDPASTARHKLNLLKQGSQSVDEYVAKFREYKDDTGYNDAALVEHFEKGLNSALVDKIYALPEMPSTLKDWISWSTKLDRQWRQREVKKKAAGNFNTTKPNNTPRQTSNFAPFVNPPKAVTPSKEPDVVPMEVDSGWRRVASKPIVCYKCRKPGHIAKHCVSSVDVNSMDYDALKAFIKEELDKEKEPKKEGF